MQIGTRFTVAVHILLCAEVFGKNRRVTSGFIAESARINAVNVRKLMAPLREAGLIAAAPAGGIRLLKKPGKISLRDVFRAVEPAALEGLFRIHHAEPGCPVGGRIQGLLSDTLAQAQEALERNLAKTTLAALLKRLAPESRVSPP